MAVIRSFNWLSQARVDLPHLRAVESAICADFDVLAGDILAGRGACIVHGFEVITTTAGIPATSVTVRTASSAILHPEASDSGTIFSVPADRADEVLSSSNTRVTGGFTASSTNYVGIDLRRTADANTADLVQFLDPDTKTEKAKTVPLARTLDYVFVVSTQEFGSTPGIAPVAKVVTDAGNNVVSVEDARNFFYRLGSGGSATDPQHAYPWPGGRSEAGNNSDFTTGDKAIGSLKDWMDAAMTRLWELGGGEHWYSATADRNVRMIRLGSATVFSSTGDWFEWVGGANLHWRGIAVLFDNSTGHINEIKDQATSSAGLTDLADGECVYVDLDRTQNLTGGSALVAVKASLSTLGTPIVPGSRFIFAWRYGSYIYTRDGQFFVGVTQPVATTSAVGTVKLNQTPGAPAAPVVPAIDSNGLISVTATVVGSITYYAVNGVGASSAANHASSGVKGTGGVYSGGGSFNSGYGVEGVGGNHTGAAGSAGIGVKGTGGAGAAGTTAAVGGYFQGGLNAAGTGAGGLYAIGGVGAVASAQGPGLTSQGGNNTGAGSAGHGVFSYGGTNTTGFGGTAVVGVGGNVTTGVAGNGVSGYGGSASNAAGSASPGGSFSGGDGTGAGAGAAGVYASGGTTGTTGVSGPGLTAIGGSNTSGSGGKGGTARGGNTTTGAPGIGFGIIGGSATGGNTTGAKGLTVQGGFGFGTGTGGYGADVDGGDGGANGPGGIGLRLTGGDAGGGNNDGGTGLDVVGGAAAGSGVGGVGISVTAGAGVGNAAIVASAADVVAYKAAVGVSSSANLPFQIIDSNANTRNYMSRLGFWSNRVSKFNEEWLMFDMGTLNDIVDESGAPNTAYATQLTWQATKGGGGAGDFTIGEPSSSCLHSYLVMYPVGSFITTDVARIASLRRFIPPPSSNDLVLEADFSVSMVAVANTDVVYVGFTSDTANYDSNATTVCFRYYGNGAAGGPDVATNWQCVTRNGSGAAHVAPGSSANSTVTNSGVAISTASEPTQRLRIEIMGASYVGSDTVKFYINEALVATHTTDIGGSPMYIFARSGRELVVASSARLKLGPIGVQWARQLSLNPV